MSEQLNNHIRHLDKRFSVLDLWDLKEEFLKSSSNKESGDFFYRSKPKGTEYIDNFIIWLRDRQDKPPIT